MAALKPRGRRRSAARRSPPTCARTSSLAISFFYLRALALDSPGNVVERQQPDQSIVFIDDREAPYLVFAHDLLGSLHRVVGSHREHDAVGDVGDAYVGQAQPPGYRPPCRCPRSVIIPMMFLVSSTTGIAPQSRSHIHAPAAVLRESPSRQVITGLLMISWTFIVASILL